MRTLILLMALAAAAGAQPIFGGGKTAAIIGPNGTTLPASCSGRVLYDLTADDGGNGKGLYRCDGGTYTKIGPSTGAGLGDVVGPAASVDGEAVVYNGITGKLLKRFAGTGIGLFASGVLSVDSGLQYNTSTKSLGVFGPIISGQTGNYLGKIQLNGITSGTVTIEVEGAAGTWTLRLPTTLGSDGQVLTRSGANGTAWTTPGTGSMVYPGAGVPNSTGSAWGTSYGVGTSANNLVQLDGSGRLPAVSAALLTGFPILNQNTTGNAGTATALATNGANCSANQAAGGVNASGAAENCIAPLLLTGGTLTGASGVTGSADAVQLAVKGHSTQTAAIFRVTKSDDTVLFAVNNDGSIQAGSASAPSVMTLTEGTAPGAGNSAGQHTVYIDSADGRLKSHENGGSAVTYALTSELGGSPAFNAISGGTNTTAAMVVGTGASISATGSGAITATAVPVGGVSGLGTGVGTFLATPSSANLASAVTGETGSGALVFGTSPTFTTSVILPQGTGPTVDTAGNVAVDTTTDQLQFYGGAKRALPSIQHVSFVIPAPAAADDMVLMKAPYGMSILAIKGVLAGSTNVVGQLQECNSTGGSCADLDSDITFDGGEDGDDGTLTDATIASGNWIAWKTTSVSGTPTFLTITVTFRVVAD